MATRETTLKASQSADSLPTLMIVEVSGNGQLSLKEFFVVQGFRAMLTQDPQRALMRFKTWPRPDFLLISAQVLQDSAVELFNQFPQDPYLARVPVLMIGSRSQQEYFLAAAKTDEFRKILLMPFRSNLLLKVVRTLLAASRAAVKNEEGEGGPQRNEQSPDVQVERLVE